MRVPAVCAYPKVLEESAAEHGGIRPPHCWEHNDRRRLVRIVPPISGLWLVCIHSPCVCNEIVSAANRVLGVVPLPTRDALMELRRESKRLSKSCGSQEPWTLEQVLNSFSGRRRRRYEDAYRTLLVDPIVPSDARIQSFVKAEKFDPGTKCNPDPRMIQARSPRYNLVIAKYLRPVEHIIYGLVGATGIRQVAKGMNQSVRAATICDKYKLFRTPVCFSIDCSRWDKHVNLDVLKVEHGFYRSLFPEYPEFDKLLSWQLVNRCRTAGGVKYIVNGGRMSGDINTALGNCLLMVLMVRAAMRILSVQWYDLLDDGDDCLVFVEESDFDTVRNGLDKIFLQFGQELKIENIAYEISAIVFCQSRVVFVDNVPLMVRDWRKVLSHACCGTRHWNNPKMVRPMFGLVGACELALAQGVPILQSFALALKRLSQGKVAKITHADMGVVIRLRHEYGNDWEAVIATVGAIDVLDTTRASFADAFGVSDAEQRHIENLLNHWQVTTDECADFGLERDHTWEDLTALQNMLPIL